MGFAFTQVAYDVKEGDGVVEICVDLITGTVQEAVSIELSTQDVSATGGLDFSSISLSVTFPAGTSPGGPGSQQCAEFPITDDNLVERQEDFRVIARSDSSLVTFPRGPSSTITINDNDSECSTCILHVSVLSCPLSLQFPDSGSLN